MNKKKFSLFIIIFSVLLIVGCMYKIFTKEADTSKLILLFAGLFQLINAVISFKNSDKHEKIKF